MDTTSLAHSEQQPRPEPPEETPHFCYEGWVFLGYEGVDEDGEMVEVGTDRVPCRRCQSESW